jgi:hypothetical protein
MNDLAPVIGVTTIFALAAWVLRTLILAYRQGKTARMQADLQQRLLERFGSSQELLAFLQTEAGDRFVEPLRTGEHPGSPYGRILGAVQVGVILLCGGFGLLFLDGRLPFDDERAFLFLGTVATALGVGFLLSGGVAYWLSHTWGLLDEREA